jgi:hypothetical protein
MNWAGVTSLVVAVSRAMVDPRDAGLGIWKDESVWFSSSVQSRKARNLRADPRCVVTTDDPSGPSLSRVWPRLLRDLTAIEEMVSRVNEKYSSKATLEFMDPDVNATFGVRPRWVFSLNDKAFTESPTRREFEGRRRR